MKCDSEKIEGSEKTMPSGAICVNRYIPSRTKKQNYKDNIEQFKEKYQRIKNTDHFKQRIQCRCGKYYTENGKGRHLKTQCHKKYILSILYI